MGVLRHVERPIKCRAQASNMVASVLPNPTTTHYHHPFYAQQPQRTLQCVAESAGQPAYSTAADRWARQAVSLLQLSARLACRQSH